MSEITDNWILDDSLRVRVFFDPDDCGFDDNICVQFLESCPEEEKVFKYDETHLYLTEEQAVKIARALLKSVEESKSYQ